MDCHSFKVCDPSEEQDGLAMELGMPGFWHAYYGWLAEPLAEVPQRSRSEGGQRIRSWRLHSGAELGLVESVFEWAQERVGSPPKVEPYVRAGTCVTADGFIVRLRD